MPAAATAQQQQATAQQQAASAQQQQATARQQAAAARPAGAPPAGTVVNALPPGVPGASDDHGYRRVARRGVTGALDATGRH
jgi:hypothetical protein